MADSKAHPPEDEDDYLTMTFDDLPNTTKTETLTQKKRRQAREAETKGKSKPKAELAADEKAKREAALNNKEIDTSSKGFKMMAALGYKPGTALGAEQQNGHPDTRLREPIGLEMREGRGGIGADAEKKRKFREEIAAKEDTLKRRKLEEGDFRIRQQKEREEKKMEGQMFGAMKVCERLEEEDEASNAIQPETTTKKRSRPLSSMNVLWRGLIKQRAVKERDRRMRYDLHQSLSRRPTYDDPDEDNDDKVALGKQAETVEEDVELDQEDEELDEFESLEVVERLQKLVSYLRENWHYCFWCKHQYSDASMEGCPGTTEEDHD